MTPDVINKLGWLIPERTIKRIIDYDDSYRQRKTHYPSTFYSEQNRNVMFIFGAGASANCVFGTESEIELFRGDTLRPPLGNELFSPKFKHYYQSYQGVKQSLHFLQDENANVEELFEEEWDDISEGNNTVLKRHINIQYYIQEILQKASFCVCSNYNEKNLFAKLANKLQKAYSRNPSKKFAFVSFNQDTILEFFLEEQFGKKIDKLEDYISDNRGPFAIFKPHGSWNWGWKFPNTEAYSGHTPQKLFSDGVDFDNLYFDLLGNHIDMVDWSDWGRNSSFNPNGLGSVGIDKSSISLIPNHGNLNHYFPSILLPYRDKDDFTMPSSHLKRMTSYFEYVETLIIIGWKGNEAAFNRLLFDNSNNLKRIIVADPTPTVVEKNLSSLISRKGIELIKYSSFEDFIKHGISYAIN